MGSKKKINWLLILQGWAMLWVVIGHAFLGKPGEGPEWENALFHCAYSLHMPLFMLVSGWLFYLTRLKPVDPTWGGAYLDLSRGPKRQGITTFIARIGI